ncbi:hypothetical protein LCGC14_2128790 [marine sediment metagenome]|uniref:Uncharacterized protein n=1 Tax=marine sediment metagenome TaxID=412755 RepID=A0A0F9GY68_9ZZZZ
MTHSTEENAGYYDDDIIEDQQIKSLQKKGHTFHCAMRIITGDGECECSKKNVIPGRISQLMYLGRCPVCLCPDSKEHKQWCRNRKGS